MAIERLVTSHAALSGALVMLIEELDQGFDKARLLDRLRQVAARMETPSHGVGYEHEEAMAAHLRSFLLPLSQRNTGWTPTVIQGGLAAKCR